MLKTAITRMAALIFISTIFLACCSPSNNPGTPSVESPTFIESTSTANPQDSPIEDTDAPLVSTPSETPTPTFNPPTPTPIIETRLPPEQWQDWPVIPELTGRELAIYQRGRELGNDPTNFSKVGDCQAIKAVLMGIYDQPDRYRLAESDAYLQETIDNFAGSFNRDGQAVRGGYNTAAVLSPMWADPEVCNPGETPIACEYRLHKPSFVIISLEVWWEGRTVERYEEYMRQIIDFYIDNGVVPILSTKADNVEGDHRINLATARLAYEYHIPLWNFWRAVQSMPNHGIDPNRDGFHISYAAWTVRSYTALQALDAVWRGVRDQQTDPISSTVTPQPEETITASPISISPQPADSPIPTGSEKWVFSLMQRTGDATLNQGVFVYDLQNESLYQVLESGYKLEDINPDSSTLLVSKDRHLFVSDLNGENLHLITDHLASSGRDASAFWMPDGRQIVVLTDEDATTILSLVDTETNTWVPLTEGNFSGLLKPASSDTIYWYEGQCDQQVQCEEVTLWLTHLGQTNAFMEKNNVVFSQSGEYYAWVETSSEYYLILYTRFMPDSFQNYLYVPGNRMLDMSWSPTTSQLALLTANVSDYSGKSSDARVLVVNTNAMLYQEYGNLSGLNPSLFWQQNGESILLTSTLVSENNYQVNLRKVNLVSGTSSSLNEVLTIESEDFVTITKLFWINE